MKDPRASFTVAHKDFKVSRIPTIRTHPHLHASIAPCLSLTHTPNQTHATGAGRRPRSLRRGDQAGAQGGGGPGPRDVPGQAPGPLLGAFFAVRFVDGVGKTMRGDGPGLIWPQSTIYLYMYMPKTQQQVDFGDFDFFRLEEIKAVRYNGGFARFGALEPEGACARG